MRAPKSRPLALLTLLLAGTLAAPASAQPASQPTLPTRGRAGGPPGAAPAAPAAPAAAAADTPPTVDAAAASRALKLLTEGARLYDEGKFSQAYVAFLAAWAIKQTPSLAKNLADCEVSLGKHRDAAEHLRFILKSADAKPEEQKRAEQQLDEVTKRIGTFRVSVSIDNADVLLDGASLGKSPLRESLFVVPGKHTFEARRDRYEPARTDVEIAEGASQIVRLTMVVSGPAPEAATGLDTARPWVIRGGLILTVVGVGFGAGMASLANGQARSAAQQRTAIGDKPLCAMPTPMLAQMCADLKSTGSKQSAFANASVGMFTVGGAAALITAGLWTVTILTKNQPPFKPLTGLVVAPSAGAHEGGAVLSGRF